MSFKSYRATPVDEGFELDQPRPLVFSGHAGLIARYISANPQAAAEPWKLCPGELHALAMPDLLVRDRMILFEDSHEEGVDCQWLQEVRGISSDTTEMMFCFTPLQIVGRQADKLIVCELQPRRTYAEDLSLDGGVMKLKGTWHWKKPHLSLGGVVLGSKAGVAAKPLISAG